MADQANLLSAVTCRTSATSDSCSRRCILLARRLVVSGHLSTNSALLIDQSAEPVESFPALFMADPGTAARGHQARNVLVSYTASTLVVCLVILVAVGSCRRLISNSSSNSRKLDLTVVVPCDRFQHTRDNSLLHTLLFDVLWLFPSSSQDECSVLTRRALLSLSAQTRISVGNLDDLVTPRLFGCEAACARTLDRPAVRQAVVAGCAFPSVAARSRLCV